MSRFEQIINIADDAIISVDSDQLICLFNEGAERVFGYSATEVNGEEFPAIGSILKTGDAKNRNFTVILHDISEIEELKLLLQQRIDSLQQSNQDMSVEQERLHRTEDLLDRLLKQAHS